MIIENGLDIPRVNTLLVNRADRFGLEEARANSDVDILVELESELRTGAPILLRPGHSLRQPLACSVILVSQALGDRVQ